MRDKKGKHDIAIRFYSGLAWGSREIMRQTPVAEITFLVRRSSVDDDDVSDGEGWQSQAANQNIVLGKDLSVACGREGRADPTAFSTECNPAWKPRHKGRA